ncbi:hypothetical protein BD560DRAFT_343196 [Blakeslea trispora]|nr:hypothetical protein BD560DRAFT_343196 [Blakeslea trispora]
MHRRLAMPEPTADPLSFLLNILPVRCPRSFEVVIAWSLRWSAICRILCELDYLQHSKTHPPLPNYLG